MINHCDNVLLFFSQPPKNKYYNYKEYQQKRKQERQEEQNKEVEVLVIIMTVKIEILFMIHSVHVVSCYISIGNKQVLH